MKVNKPYHDNCPSISSAIRQHILSSSLHDLLQIDIKVQNAQEYQEGNEVNFILRSVINFQNSLMRELITCQLPSNSKSMDRDQGRFSDVNFIFDGNQSFDLSRIKFPIIEPVVGMVMSDTLRFYASKGIVKYFPGAFEEYQAQCEFSQLVLPKIEVTCVGTHKETQIYSIFMTGLELHVLCGDYELPKPVQHDLSHYLPPYLSDYCSHLDQGMLFALIMLVNSTFSKEMLDLFCGQVALMIRGKSTEQIIETFNIQNGK